MYHKFQGIHAEANVAELFGEDGESSNDSGEQKTVKRKLMVVSENVSSDLRLKIGQSETEVKEKYENRAGEISNAESGILDQIQRLNTLKISDDMSIVEEPMLGEIHRLKQMKICDEVTVMPEFEEKALDQATD